jgi:hydroxymethylglutaryl-CoA lyase
MQTRFRSVRGLGALNYPQRVSLVEVGPRDGLQNEPSVVATRTKAQFIDRLSETGLAHIEGSSFVKPQSVPQLADAEAVFTQIRRKQGITYSALVPNTEGLDRALSVGVSEISVFAAASDTFSRKNINCDIRGSLRRFEPVLKRADTERLKVRAYLSCVLGCPYEGRVDPKTVARLARCLLDMGCYEVALADTIGIGTPLQARELVTETATRIPVEHIALHFHDTRGQALANILACLEEGVSVFDTSVAGLGGCPYAPGASGNVATEDVVYMLNGMGIETGIDLESLIEVGNFISRTLSRANQSKVGCAGVPATR